MPRYYFHLHNSIECRDEEGTQFDDQAAAKEQAVREARALIADDVLSRGEVNLSHSIRVADESGEIVMVVTFADVVNIAH